MESKIELAKVRDFGEIISDSFLFVRENFKPLLKAFFTFCGIFLVAAAVAQIMQQIKMVNIYKDPEFDLSESGGAFRQFGLEYVLTMVFSFLAITAMQVTVMCYVVLYKEKGNTPPNNEEIWAYFKYHYFRILGPLFINAILFVIGCIFCLIPGIYLFPVLGLVFPIMVIENAGYGYAFNQAFKLIKGKWWMTFGSLFIMGLVISVAATIVMIPFSVASIAETILHPTQAMAKMSMTKIITTGILGQLFHALYILPLITLALCYFSLNEAKEGSGLLSRINSQLGNNDADHNQTTEEY